MLGSRYTRGAPPLVGMRMATPAVRAAPPAALLTACLAGGCDGGAAGGSERPPHRATVGHRGGDAYGGPKAPPAKKANRGGPDNGVGEVGLDTWARASAPAGR